MSNFIIAAGHTASGNKGCGVVHRLDESNCTREISSLVVNYLNVLGHYAKLLRIDKSNIYKFEDCYLRAEEANSIAEKINIDLYVEIHINAGGGSGCEVLTITKNSEALSAGIRINNEISNKLGIPNRGIKRNNLIVLNRTTMPALLIECLFADSDDADKYEPSLIAKAIVNGLVGKNSSENNLWNLGWNKNIIGWWYCTDVVNKYYFTCNDGWKNINGEWYRFDEKGYALENTWYHDEDKDKWYYFDENCRMVRSKNKGQIFNKMIFEEEYRFNESGEMI